ncbi:MAG: PTS system mannose/fructose/sorbose family transporter subunit IID [Deltaproteobacteria bacterium]|nr:PTS system mannose/fructose/sorbose family transporter subunit IID [Deltaproteobacteria bacterium]
MSALGTRDLLGVALRLTLVQCTWNEAGLQSAGLSFAVAPALARVHKEREALGLAVLRLGAPFNTHPYLVGVLAGAVLRLEEDGAPDEEVAAFKRGTMGPLAAVGDPFFWGALAPASTAVAVLVTLLFGPLAGVAALVLAFNIVHVFVRVAGVAVGYREGPMGLHRVAGWLGPSRTAALKVLTAVCVGAILAVVSSEAGSDAPKWAGLAMGATGLLGGLVVTRGKPTLAMFAPVVLAAALFIEVLA